MPALTNPSKGNAMTVAQIKPVDGPVDGPVVELTEEQITNDALNKSLDRIRQLDFQNLQQKNIGHKRDKIWSQHYNEKCKEITRLENVTKKKDRKILELQGKLLTEKERVRNLREIVKWK